MVEIRVQQEREQQFTCSVYEVLVQDHMYPSQLNG